METKVSLKNIYLLLLVSIGLIGLGIGSTFAVFTASTTINSPITFVSDLSANNNVIETREVTVPAYMDKVVNLTISNSSGSSKYYAAWYKCDSSALAVGASSNDYDVTTPVSSNETVTIAVTLRNRSSSAISVLLGISSDDTSLVFIPSDATSITLASLSSYAPLSDFTYILGSSQTTVSSLSAKFYNQSSGTSADESNVTLPASISINQDEVLLVRYIGSDTEVNVPTIYIDNGNIYNVVVLSYVNDGSNLSTGVFYRNDDIEEVSFGNDIKYLALNSNSNGYDDDSMSNMFNGCTSLSYLDLSTIDLDDITVYTNALTSVSTSAVITVFDCDQYVSFRTMFGNSYTNLSIQNVDNSNFNCYQRVEYIENTANSYINTGLIGRPGYTLETELSFNQLASGSYQYFAGYAYTGSADRTYYIRLNNSSKHLGYTYGSNNSGTATLSLLTEDTYYKIKSVMKSGTQQLYLDDSLIGSSSFSALSYDSSDPKYIYMFVSQYVTTVNGPTSAKCKYAKWYDENDNLVRYFVPCYRRSDGVIGLYDMENNLFYTNSGSGTFVKGADVNS